MVHFGLMMTLNLCLMRAKVRLRQEGQQEAGNSYETHLSVMQTDYSYAHSFSNSLSTTNISMLEMFKNNSRLDMKFRFGCCSFTRDQSTLESIVYRLTSADLGQKRALYLISLKQKSWLMRHSTEAARSTSIWCECIYVRRAHLFITFLFVIKSWM